MRRVVASLLVTTMLLTGMPLLAAPVKSAHTEIELLSEYDGIVPGQPFTVALRMTMDPHWHTYWQNPGGEAGLPTRISWTLPEGFEAGEIVWPAPHRYEDELLPGDPPIVSYGYSDTIALLVEITPPPKLEAETDIMLSAKVSWLACKETCIPGRGAVELSLPVVGARTQNAEVAALIAQTHSQQARGSKTWQLAAAGGEVLQLLVITPGGSHDPGALTFIPETKDTIDDSAAQATVREGAGSVVTVPWHGELTDKPEQIRGIMRAANGWGDGEPEALLVNLPVVAQLPGMEAIAGPVEATPEPEPAETVSMAKILNAILLAFLGGIILNLMPCVLPVLSLKIMDFVHQAGDNPRGAWRHGLVFTAGVLVSFLILALVVVGLQAAGQSIGWGFQLQEPRFVFLLIAVLFIFGLSMFGICEFGTSLTSLGGGAKKGYAGSFFSGALATVVATPCTAPFMAGAVGFAFSQPPIVQIIIFEALGLGMALPYLILSSSPKLMAYMPKPGAWMETLKQFLGFLLMATVVWLLWVLGSQAGNNALGAVLMGLVVLALGTWVYGRWCSPVRKKHVRTTGKVVAILLLIAGITLGLKGISLLGEQPTASAASLEGEGIAWEAWDPDQIAGHREAGKPVFIDFTADWCITCKANERVAFREQVANRFKELGVVPMKADWTNYDEDILNALEAHGRSGVPLYVYYPADTSKPPRVLPQLLTESIVLKALE